MPFLFLWGLLTEESKPSYQLWNHAHGTWEKACITLCSPHGHTLFLCRRNRSLPVIDRNCPREMLLCMFHLPVEGHWSHRCHIQTGKNPAQQWRQWKPRSRWSVGNETQGWKTPASSVTQRLLSPQLGLLTGCTGWDVFLDIHSVPCVPSRVTHTTMWQPFIIFLTLLMLKRVGDGFFQGRNQKSCYTHTRKFQNQDWELEWLWTEGNC